MLRRAWGAVILVAVASGLAGTVPSAGQPSARHARPGKSNVEKPAPGKPILPPPGPSPARAPPAETKPYDPQLMRLSEILGALTYLRDLCGDADADQWRARMQSLLDAEGTPPSRKDRLAGAYNKGIEGYSLSYRTCTANAHAVIERFLVEGGQIAKAVENRYRAS